MTNTEPAASTSSARVLCSTRKQPAFPLFKLSGELRSVIYGYITDEIAAETEWEPVPLKRCVFNYIVDTHDGSHVALRTNSITTVSREFSALSQASSQLRQEFWPFSGAASASIFATAILPGGAPIRSSVISSILCRP